VPFAKDDDLIGRLADAIPLPLNVILMPGLSPAARLQALGVRRLSCGTSPFKAMYAPLAKAAAAYLATGEASAWATGAEGLANLNQRFG
jgi:2-methylisocitrate lyase-like PEP mutase family enzyme